MAKQKDEVKVNLPTEDDTVLEGVEVKAVETKEVLHDVSLKVDFRAYLGDRWWDLKKGTHKVPEYVKERLKKVGVLNAI